jgi:hypothetical protein
MGLWIGEYRSDKGLKGSKKFDLLGGEVYFLRF